MNITEALKQKSRLIRDIRKERDRLFRWNTYVLGSTVPYEAKPTYENWMMLKKELVTLKSKIQVANVGIQETIFLLSEKKDTLENLKGLKCIEGELVTETYSTQTIEVSGISLLERDRLIQNLETEIDELQNKIEAYNHQTTL